MTDFSYNFLTIGYDCSPAAALRSLNLRHQALPFDWVQSNISAIQYCFATDFKYYHTNIFLNNGNTRLIDEYGFQFPHDYPTITSPILNLDGTFSEDIIIDDWQSYYPNTKNKYNRRIERFKNILKDPKPAIVLCRYSTQEVFELQKYFIRYYNKSNLFFLNAYPQMFMNDKIININPEKNNEWNDATIWKEGIQSIEKLIVDSL
jgi:hypothetical protein